MLLYKTVVERLLPHPVAVFKRQFMGASSSSKKMNQTKPPVKVPAKEKATASLIFLHGLGDQGDEWAKQFGELSLKNIRCVCPHARPAPVTLNHGFVMPSWFDIKSLAPGGSEDEAGIKAAAKELKALIDQEVKDGISPDKIMIGGFSQGGGLAMYTAFATDVKIGGVLALSSWIPLYNHFKDSSTTKYNSGVPVLQCHGESDPLVAYRFGQASNEVIKSFNPNAQLKSYKHMGHHSSTQEMQDVKAFLEQVLGGS